MVCENPQFAVVLGTGARARRARPAQGNRAAVAAHGVSSAVTAVQSGGSSTTAWPGCCLRSRRCHPARQPQEPGPAQRLRPGGPAPVVAARRRRCRGSSAASAALWSRYVWLVHVEDENERAARRQRAPARELARATPRARRRHRGARGLWPQAAAPDPGRDLGARASSPSTLTRTSASRRVRHRSRRGARSRPGMPVIDAAGLVGPHPPRLRRATPTSCWPSIPQSSIDVVIAAHRRARRAHRHRRATTATAARSNTSSAARQAHEGDQVVTSGLGSAFPPGSRSAHRAGRPPPSTGCTRRSRSSPLSTSRAARVLVVLAPPPPPDPGRPASTVAPRTAIAR